MEKKIEQAYIEMFGVCPPQEKTIELHSYNDMIKFAQLVSSTDRNLAEKFAEWSAIPQCPYCRVFGNGTVMWKHLYRNDDAAISTVELLNSPEFTEYLKQK